MSSNKLQAIFLERLEGIGTIMEQQITEALEKGIDVEVCIPFPSNPQAIVADVN